MSLYSSLGLFYRQVLQEPGKGEALIHPQIPAPATLDVRDAARAHILALAAPSSNESGVGHKRILICGPYFTWRDATEHLAVSHPDLAAAGRLKDIDTSQRAKNLKILRYDNSRLESVLGFKQFIPWEKTVDDAIDSIAATEKALGVY